MSNVEIRVDSRAVMEALDKLDSRESGKALKAAVAKGGRFLKGKMKPEAPKAERSKNPGHLRKKVGVRTRKSKRHAGFYTAVRSFARHHHLVVAGTKDRFTKSGAFRGRMPTNGYVDRTADQWENAALDVAERELANQLDLE